jgi:hypothetical protein
MERFISEGRNPLQEITSYLTPIERNRLRRASKSFQSNVQKITPLTMEQKQLFQIEKAIGEILWINTFNAYFDSSVIVTGIILNTYGIGDLTIDEFLYLLKVYTNR